MSELRIFDPQRIQVYPNSGDKTEATEQVLANLRNTVPLYVDLSSLRVLTLLYGTKSSKPSHRSTYHLVEYLGDGRDTLFSDFVTDLHSLETSEGWDFDEAIDPKFRMPWFLGSAAPQSLTDLGFTQRSQFVVESALDDDAKFTFGIEDYETAASLVTHLTLRTNTDATIAISPEGRHAAIGSAELVLDPTSDHFAQLDDQTTDQLREYIDEVDNLVRSKLEDPALTAVDLIKVEAVHRRQYYQELSRLQEIIESSRTRTGFETDAAARAAELTLAVRNGETIDGIDPTFANKTTREKLVSTVRQRVQEELTKVEEHIEEHILAEFETQVDRLEDQDIDLRTKVEALRMMRAELRGDEIENSDVFPDPLSKVSSLFDEFHPFDPAEKDDFREAVQHRITLHLERLKAKQKAEYRMRFKAAFEELESESTEVDSREEIQDLVSHLSAIQEVLDDPSAETDVDSAAVGSVRALTRDILTDSVLEGDDLLDELKNKVSEFQNKRRNKTKQQLYTDLKEFVDERLRSTGTRDRPVDAYERLEQARGLCSRAPDPVEDSTLEEFRAKIVAVNDHPLLGSLHKKRLRDQLADHISKAIDEVRAEKRKRIVKTISSHLRLLDDESRKSTVSTLKALDRRIEKSGVKSEKDLTIEDEQVSRVRDTLEEIADLHERGFFDDSDVEWVKESIREEISERITEIREEEEEAVEDEFETFFEGMANEPPEERIRLFRSVKAILSGRQKRLPDGRGGETAKRLLEKLRNDYVVLSDAQQTEFRTQFQERLTEEITEVQQHLESTLKEQVKEAVRAEQPTAEFGDDPDPNEIDAYLKFLRDVDEAVVTKTRVGHARIDELLETARETLQPRRYGDPTEDNAYDRFAENIRDFLDSKIDTKEEKRTDIIQSSIKSEIKRIDEEVDSTEARIRLLRKLRQVVDGNEVEMGVTLSDGSHVRVDLKTANLHKLCSDTSEDHSEALDIRSRRDELSAQLADECYGIFVEELDKYVESDETDDPAVGLSSLQDYVTEAKRSAPGSKLDPVITAIDRIDELHTERVIRSEHYKETKNKLQQKIESRTAEYNEGDGWAGPMSSRPPTPGKISIRQTFVFIAGLFLIIAIVVIAGSQLGVVGGFDPVDLWSGQSPPAETSQPAVTNLTVNHSDNVLRVRGDVSGNASQVSIEASKEGGSSQEQQVILADGSRSFQHRFDINGTGIYSVSVSPMVGNDPIDNSLTVSTLITSSSRGVAVQQPQGNTAVESGELTLVATTDIETGTYILRLLNQTGNEIDRQNGSIDGGKVRTNVSVEPEVEYLLLFVSNDTGPAATELVHIRVLQPDSSGGNGTTTDGMTNETTTDGMTESPDKGK